MRSRDGVTGSDAMESRKSASWSPRSAGERFPASFPSVASCHVVELRSAAPMQVRPSA